LDLDRLFPAKPFTILPTQFLNMEFTHNVNYQQKGGKNKMSESKDYVEVIVKLPKEVDAFIRAALNNPDEFYEEALQRVILSVLESPLEIQEKTKALQKQLAQSFHINAKPGFETIEW